MRTALALAMLSLVPALVLAEDPPLVEKYLMEGKLAAGEAALRETIAKKTDDDQARFGLGSLQFLRAVERLSQGMYRYGLSPEPTPFGLFRNVPLPFRANPDPRIVRYSDLRAAMQVWLDDLAEAEATLAAIKDENVKLPLHFGLIRLDFDGDGDARDGELLWKLYNHLNTRTTNWSTAESAKKFVVTFDRGDVAWLRGYCHLLMAMTEVALAYDGKELFARCGHLAFAKTDSPFGAVLRHKKSDQNPMYADIMDLIAAVHLVNMPLAEPKRMTAALKHMEAVIALSRESWKFILAETDNDHEWVPNPKQDTVMPGGQVTEGMVKGWMGFLDEAEAILAGKTLVPFWRGPDGLGVNLHKVFTEPRDFDLVLWVQGTAAMPYVEDGPKTTAETWGRLQRLFSGEFIGFAFWFN